MCSATKKQKTLRKLHKRSATTRLLNILVDSRTIPVSFANGGIEIHELILYLNKIMYI